MKSKLKKGLAVVLAGTILASSVTLRWLGNRKYRWTKPPTSPWTTMETVPT